ncbi:hypothetical protein PFISCL1PPCAC_12425, partial [Pristionchus fissidentatus]
AYMLAATSAAAGSLTNNMNQCDLWNKAAAAASFAYAANPALAVMNGSFPPPSASLPSLHPLVSSSLAAPSTASEPTAAVPHETTSSPQPSSSPKSVGSSPHSLEVTPAKYELV